MWVNINFPPGISMNESRRLSAMMRDVLRNSEVVRTVTSKAGRPDDGTDPKPINMTEFFVDLKPPAEWPQELTPKRSTDQFSQKLSVLPGVGGSFPQPLRTTVRESTSKSNGSIVTKL